MILFYFPDDISATRVPAALAGAGVELRTARAWSEVQELPDAPECTVLAARPGESARHLSRLVQRWPTAPVVVVGESRAEAARAATLPQGAPVAWCAAGEREIAAAVATARVQGYLMRVDARIRLAQHLPPRLRQALSHVCRGGAPGSVHEVASHLRCTPRVLSHHWRKAVPATAGVRLEDFLAWILLLHAISLRIAGGKWSSIAEGLGSHPHTLTRTAMRLSGTPLRELPLEGMGAAVDRFESQVIRYLLVKHDF